MIKHLWLAFCVALLAGCYDSHSSVEQLARDAMEFGFKCARQGESLDACEKELEPLLDTR